MKRSVAFGDMFELQRRSVPVDLDQQYQEVGVRSFGRGLFVKESVSGVQLGSKRVFYVHGGDLVISNVFGWEGAVAVAEEQHHELIGSHRFMTWTPISDVDVRYVLQFLLSDPGLQLLREASPGSAGRNRTLSVKNLLRIPIPLRTLTEQRRIADHLDAIDEVVGEQLSRRELAVSMRDQLPQVLAGAFAAEGAPMIAVEELIDVVTDTVHPGMPLRGATTFVGLEHIEPHTGRRVGGRPVVEETGRKFRFEPGDLTYGYLRPYLNKVWAADLFGLCSVEQFVLRPRQGVSPTLLSHALRNSTVLEMVNAETNNLQLPRLKMTSLLAMPVVDVRMCSASLAKRLGRLTSLAVESDRLQRSRVDLWGGLLPSARNEIFSSMQ